MEDLNPVLPHSGTLVKHYNHYAMLAVLREDLFLEPLLWGHYYAAFKGHIVAFETLNNHRHRHRHHNHS